jgi:2,4-dienoyl-CoA reductase-like NADH-dependent reductase (Old Yellow Enzyme family)/thioredoxin reductase
MFKKIFEPIKIGEMELKNRLTTAAMDVSYCDSEGTVTDRYLSYIEARVKGGWGLIISEATAVSKQGIGYSGSSVMYDDKFIEGQKKVAEMVHSYGGKMVVQLIHAGRQTMSAVTGCQIVAPSAIKDPTMPEVPHDLTIDEIQGITKDFVDAAIRVQKAGFDGIEIHGAHGYLIQQFMSPYSNRRSDSYGGSLVNRTKFAVEITEEVRKAVGPEFPIIFRISAEEYVPGGLTIAETKAIAKIIEAAGADAIHVSVGNYTSGCYISPGAGMKKAYQAEFAKEIKSVVSIPVITAGRQTDPFIAEATLESGQADLIAMARASLADPEFPNKVKEGRLEDIIYCIGCLQGCLGRLTNGLEVQCLVNPLTGNEREYVLTAGEVKKNVAVIGGGVAGMEAAIAAARRGHKVTIYEKESKLGGQWLLAAVPPEKQELNTFTFWQKNQIEKLGIEVKLNCEFNEKELVENNYDAAVIATGSIPMLPPIRGIDSGNVVTALDILSSQKDAGNKVVVIGGGQVGAETAAYLGMYGKDVTVIEMLDKIAKDGQPQVNMFLFENLKDHNVKLLVNAKVLEITGYSVIYETDGQVVEIKDVDTVVMAVGSKSVNTLNEKLEGKIKTVIVGDALKAGNALDGVHQGYNAGFYI